MSPTLYRLSYSDGTVRFAMLTHLPEQVWFVF